MAEKKSVYNQIRMAKDDLIPVRVLALLEEPLLHSPVVILHDPVSNRVLPIWIGEPEARAIAIAFQGISISRPLTHTLLRQVIEQLGASVMQVVVDRIESATYFATIYLKKAGKRGAVLVDARPSDAIALAMESGVPLFVHSTVLAAAGQDNPFPTESSDQTKHSQAKRSFSPQEFEHLKTLLEKARKREEGMGE